jgi:hypothetical protein
MWVAVWGGHSCPPLLIFRLTCDRLGARRASSVISAKTSALSAVKGFNLRMAVFLRRLNGKLGVTGLDPFRASAVRQPYFAATNCLAFSNSGRAELPPAQSFTNCA